MGTNYYLVKTKPTASQPLHIGKSSAGWKFHFYDTNEWDYDNCAPVPLHTFNQWQDYIHRTVANGSRVIIDEYDEIVPEDEFFELVELKQAENNPDDFTWCRDVDGYRFDSQEFS